MALYTISWPYAIRRGRPEPAFLTFKDLKVNLDTGPDRRFDHRGRFLS